MLAVITMSLAGIVQTVLFMLVAAAVIGLLWWLIGYVQASFGGPEIIYKVIRVLLVIMLVVALIGLLLSLVGEPLVRITT
jgi:hypothetical protein